MFDLNEQIARWRAGLSESEELSKPDIDELETHLREEMEHLTPAGLSQQEAFVVAKGRLGDTAGLESEFAKVNGGYIFRRRLFWMTAGILAYLLAMCLAGASGNAGAFIGTQMGLGAYAAAVLGIAAGLLLEAEFKIKSSPVPDRIILEELLLSLATLQRRSVRPGKQH